MPKNQGRSTQPKVTGLAAVMHVLSRAWSSQSAMYKICSLIHLSDQKLKPSPKPEELAGEKLSTQGN